LKNNDTAAAPVKAQPAAGKLPEAKGANKAASGEGFVVQVGAYSNTAAAKQESNKLKKWGFKAYTEKTGGKVRVRVGPFAEREKAEKIRQQLEKHGLSPVVMSTK
jgi:DedD protein